MSSKRADKYSIARAWTPSLANSRFVPVVRAFLENYSSLKPFSLTHGEAMFVIHLMQFKWDEAAPFPGYKRIARLMGVSDKMVRRYALSLEQKGYLVRITRQARTNRFDLRKLFSALEKRLEELNAVRTQFVQSPPTTHSTTSL
jgi:DNA-binding MarR family transcriptional regulator